MGRPTRPVFVLLSVAVFLIACSEGVRLRSRNAGSLDPNAIESEKFDAHVEANKAENASRQMMQELNGVLSLKSEEQLEPQVANSQEELKSALSEEKTVLKSSASVVEEKEAALKQAMANLKSAENAEQSEKSTYASGLVESESMLEKSLTHARDEYVPAEKPQSKKELNQALAKKLFQTSQPKDLKEAKLRLSVSEEQVKELESAQDQKMQEQKKEQVKTGGWGNGPMYLEGEKEPAAAATPPTANVDVNALMNPSAASAPENSK